MAASMKEFREQTAALLDDMLHKLDHENGPTVEQYEQLLNRLSVIIRQPDDIVELVGFVLGQAMFVEVIQERGYKVLHNEELGIWSVIGNPKGVESED